MTVKEIYVCDGDSDDCIEQAESEEPFRERYKKVHPNNRSIVEKKHYCRNCEIPKDTLAQCPHNYGR